MNLDILLLAVERIPSIISTMEELPPLSSPYGGGDEFVSPDKKPAAMETPGIGKFQMNVDVNYCNVIYYLFIFFIELIILYCNYA